ncbi:MAG: extracellular solute-binding protein, partial [Micrococcales bacterium]|nr:extracellular solute-binding protein [Micrococcales bacterium]
MAAISLTSCSSGGAPSSSGSAAGSTSGGASGTPLRVMAISSDKPGLDTLVAAYSKTPNAVAVTPDYVANDGYDAALRTQLTSGTAPDIFEVSPGNGNAIAVAQLGQGGYLADLSDQPWVSQIPSGTADATQFNGKTVMLPITGGVFGMLYNTKIFAQYNLTPPTTWSELLSDCQTLKDAGITPIAMGNGADGFGSLFLTYQMAASTNYAVDKNWASERIAGTVTFKGSGWADALNKFVELNQKGYFGTSPNGTALADAQSQFATGKAGMIAIVSQQLGGIQQSAGTAASDFSSFPFPAVDNADGVYIAAGSGYGYAINAKTKNMDAALKFLQTAAQPAQVKAFNLALGGIPLLPSDPGAVPEALAPLVPFVTNGKSATYMDQYWPNADV